MCIRDRIIEVVSEKFDTKINSVDDKIGKINETIIEKVQNQIETQSREIENKCLAAVD